ncbi:MAG: hypothetical protein AB8G17_11520 [Gammaproteobacteria bacterium]
MQTSQPNVTTRIRNLVVGTVALVLAACGGGGGGGSTPAPVTPPPASGDTTISGKISFERVPHTFSNGLNYNATTSEPAREVVVELVDAAGAVVAEGQTDANGDYSLTVSSGQTLRLRARAQMVATGTPAWNFRVVDNTANNALYVVEGPASVAEGDTQTRSLLAESGWGGNGYTSDRAAGPFAILDSVYQAYNKVLDVEPQAVFPDLNLHWSENNRPVDGDISAGEITTSFYTRDAQGNSAIFLLGAANSDTDEYDGHVVIHEWGHYFEDRFSRSDSVGGPHSGGDRLDLRVAFSEGYGYALAGMVTDDPITRDSGGFNQGGGFSIDVEDDNFATNPSGNRNPGWFSEGSVQLILYDLYDSDADGIDTVALGFGPIHDVLTGDFSNDTAVTSIFSFAEYMRAAQPADVAGINSLLEAKNIVGAGNDRYGSSETNNAGNANDVLPVFTPLPTDGSPVVVCSLGVNEFGTFNKLSNRRLLRFTLGSAGRYRIAVSGAADPDIALFQGDFLAVAQLAGNDAIERDLAAGEYVVEVYEFANVRPDQAATASGRECLTVSLTAI